MSNELDKYPHAMTIDSETGKPMMKVQVSGGLGGSMDDYYTKEESDSIFQEKGEYVTESTLTQTIGSLQPKGDYATKDQVNNRATKTEHNNLMDRVAILEDLLLDNGEE